MLYFSKYQSIITVMTSRNNMSFKTNSILISCTWTHFTPWACKLLIRSRQHVLVTKSRLVEITEALHLVNMSCDSLYLIRQQFVKRNSKVINRVWNFKGRFKIKKDTLPARLNKTQYTPSDIFHAISSASGPVCCPNPEAICLFFANEVILRCHSWSGKGLWQDLDFLCCFFSMIMSTRKREEGLFSVNKHWAIVWHDA